MRRSFPQGDVQKLIDALPATDKLTTMTKDEQNAVYADLQAAYEAYQALTEDRTGTAYRDRGFRKPVPLLQWYGQFTGDGERRFLFGRKR